MSADDAEKNWRQYGSMPSTWDTDTHDRAQTTIIQRNGLLILLQVSADYSQVFILFFQRTP